MGVTVGEAVGITVGEAVGVAVGEGVGVVATSGDQWSSVVRYPQSLNPLGSAVRREVLAYPLGPGLHTIPTE